MREAKADADYAVAKERCDDAAGNHKNVCMKEAGAAHVNVTADAKVQTKTVADAKETISKKSADVRNNAVAEKNGSAYAGAMGKRDSQAGGVKDDCLMQARARFVEIYPSKARQLAFDQ